ncbi:MAG TPA: ATP-binding protein, partial [Planctomycetota bacterium]|nr:ATP-binding protein [Planctomycetota bacterium]
MTSDPRNGPADRWLRFARALLGAHSYPDVLAIARAEVQATMGYDVAAIVAFERDDDRFARLVGVAGANAAAVRAAASLIPIRGDALLQEVLRTRAPVVVADAATDPRPNPQIVAALGCRTVILVPLDLPDRPFGLFTTGTFGDEGVRVPTAEQIQQLLAMAGYLAAAAARIQLDEERQAQQRQRLEFDQRLRRVEQLESLWLLASGVAHDFNDLLTTIVGNVRLMADDPERRSLFANSVGRAVERGRSLTWKLLAISGRQPLQFAPVDLQQRIRAMIEALQQRLPAAVEIAFTVADDLAPVLADAAQIDEVLLNLCLNARDAMPGGGTIRIRLDEIALDAEVVQHAPWAAPGRYARITVADHGSGLSPELLERIFEPLLGSKDDAHGSGLGLAIVHGIVRQHGGMVHVDSQLGAGCRFEVLLPMTGRAVGNGVPGSAAATAPRRLPARQQNGRGNRILVAEDDPGVCNV